MVSLDGTSPGPGRRLARVGNLDVIDRRGELPEAAGGYPTRDLGGITALVVHHSATPATTTAEAIARYHVEERGWPGIGYHFLVFADGRIEYVGDLATARYHVKGQNERSVGVCLVGDFMGAMPAAVQVARAARLLAEVQFQLGWFVPIYGHGELSGDSACPGATFLRGWRQALVCRGG